MAYLIDGHNVIGQMPDLSLDDPHDEAKLVERLRSFSARTRKRCTVIFDGGLPGGPSTDLSTHSVKVVFAHGGTNADAIILERIESMRDANHLTIVSADHAITDAATRRRMRVISPAQFVREMARPPSVPEADGHDPNPRITRDEVDMWLREFGVEPDDAAE